MKHTLKNQAKRTGIMVAALGALAALGIGITQAAPPTGTPTFVSADLSIEPRGEAAGGLTCTWRETGVGASAVVYYACAASDVGAFYACTYKHRVIFQSPTKLEIFHNVVGEEQNEEAFLAQKNGQISAATTTAIPEREVPEGQELCTAPSEQEVVAVRWCNASLEDTTNNIVGTTADELSQEFIPDVGTVPSCAELAAP